MVRIASVRLLASLLLLLATPHSTWALPSLQWLSSSDMPLGTHRPEILVTPAGEIIVIVVDHDGEIRHKGYRYDTELTSLGDPFPVTAFSETYGWPADHRAVIANGEILVTYQTLLDTDTEPCQSLPEHCAEFQSFMLARFDLNGNEVLRTPIVANVSDFSQDNFPDHCILWRDDHLLTSTGSLGNQTLKFREVGTDGSVQSTTQVSTSPTTIPSAIGNSLVSTGEALLIASYRLGAGMGTLSLSELDENYAPGTATTYPDAGSIQKFPTGNLWEAPYLFIAYTKHDDTQIDTDPYFTYLRTLDGNFQDVDDFRVGEGDGFGGVHPTMVRSGDRVYVAWSRVGAQNGGVRTPQVRLEVYAYDSGISTVPGALPWIQASLLLTLLGAGLARLRGARSRGEDRGRGGR